MTYNTNAMQTKSFADIISEIRAEIAKMEVDRRVRGHPGETARNGLEMGANSLIGNS